MEAAAGEFLRTPVGERVSLSGLSLSSISEGQCNPHPQRDARGALAGRVCLLGAFPQQIRWIQGRTWSAKDTDEGRVSARTGWGALGEGDWNLSLSRPYPLTHLSGMRRGQSKAQPRVANLVFCCFFFFFNTLCHPPLRSFTATRQVAALLNSKRSQRNG